MAMTTKPRLLIAADVYPDGGGISAIIENIIAELQPQYDLNAQPRRVSENDP